MASNDGIIKGQMNLKLDAVIAIKYSLLYAISDIVRNIAVVLLYKDGYGNWSGNWALLNTQIEGPILIIIFPLIIFLSHRNYRRQIGDEATFRDVLLISFFIISMTYCLRYITDTVFFYSFFERYVRDVNDYGKGIFGMLNAMNQPQKPYFNLFGHLFNHPFFILKMEILNFDILPFIVTILFDRVFYMLIILYYENLFLLFKKYQRNPWFSIVPVLNNYVLMKIADKPGWWNFLLYVPFVRYVFLYFINAEIAKDFGKDKKFALAMTVLPSIFYGGISFGNSSVDK